MGLWAESLRKRVWIKDRTGGGHRLSRKELCCRTRMSEHTYRDIASGVHTNLVGYLRVALICIDCLPKEEKERFNKELLKLLHRQLFDNHAAEPPYIA